MTRPDAALRRPPRERRPDGQALAPRLRWIGFAVLVGGALVAVAGSPVTRADLALLDAQFAWLRANTERPDAGAPSAVVVVGIDESTVAAFPEPLALWHPYLGGFLEAMAAARPAVIGLDVNLPDRSFDAIRPDFDEALARGLLAVRGRVPVVLGITVESDGTERAVYPPFLSLAGPGALGFTLAKLDPDRVVRRFDERLSTRGKAVPTLSGQMFRAIAAKPARVGEQRGIINYNLGDTYRYVPLQAVLARWETGDIATLEKQFGGRAVLLGSVLPFVDRHYQPIDLAAWEENAGYGPGVLIHAQALKSLLAGALIVDTPRPWLLPLALLAALTWWGSARWRSALPMLATGVLALVAASTALLASGVHLPVASIATILLLATVGRAGLETVDQALERNRLRQAFAGVVSPSVLREILAGRLPEVESVEVCVLFSDIRGFTTLSEEMAPIDVVEFLNAYFEEMVAAIHDASGTLDKFLGDGIMAFFGAPRRLDNPCEAAFNAAKSMLRQLEDFNSRRAELGLTPVRIGVGLHLGEVVVGHVGSRTRREYTAVGDVVNTASRLEGLTKDQGTPLVISAAVHDALTDATRARERFEPLGTIPIRGRRSGMALWGWGRALWNESQPGSDR